MSFPVFLRPGLIYGLTLLMSAAPACSTPGLRESHALTKPQVLAAGGPERETVETRLTKLFDLCASDDTEAAAPFFVYRGPDKTREWKDTLRASDPTERAGAGEICRRIKGYLEENQGYEFGAVRVEREPEGEWHALEVTFRKEGRARKVIFAFLKIKGRFAIGDIDG